MRFLLSFRGRALSYAVWMMGVAVLGPHAPPGLANFLLQPAGLAMIGLAFLLVGDFVEELGTMRRIRIGIATRLAAPVPLVVSAVWVAALGSATPGNSTFGWALVILASIPVWLIARHDLALFRDPRHGQTVRLESVDEGEIHLRIDERAAVIPITLVDGVVIQSVHDGRGVVLHVKLPAAAGDLRSIPWSASSAVGDALWLDEHQLGMDAEEFVSRLRPAIAAEGRYR